MGRRAKATEFQCEVHNVLDSPENHQGITFEQFEVCIAQDGLRRCMQELAIETGDAVALFRYLQSESSAVDRQALAAGLLRLRNDARFIDIVMILSEQARFFS